jgi:hypothetical protein
MRHWGNGITLALFVTTIGLGGCTLPQPPPPGQTPTTEVRPAAPKPAEPAPTTEARPVAAKAAGSPESP